MSSYSIKNNLSLAMEHSIAISRATVMNPLVSHTIIFGESNITAVKNAQECIVSYSIMKNTFQKVFDEDSKRISKVAQEFVLIDKESSKLLKDIKGDR